jgi:hypothetical protein
LILPFPPVHVDNLGAFKHRAKALPGILPVLTMSTPLGADYLVGVVVLMLLGNPWRSSG